MYGYYVVSLKQLGRVFKSLFLTYDKQQERRGVLKEYPNYKVGYCIGSDNSLRVIVKPTAKDGLQSFERVIHVARKTCNLGGWRLWLVCGGCKKNKYRLYTREFLSFRCRECLGWLYESQRASRHLRYYIQATKADELLHELCDKKYKYLNGRITKRFKLLEAKCDRAFSRLDKYKGVYF
jgi:hypothetical protein